MPGGLAGTLRRALRWVVAARGPLPRGAGRGHAGPPATFPGPRPPPRPRSGLPAATGGAEAGPRALGGRAPADPGAERSGGARARGAERPRRRPRARPRAATPAPRTAARVSEARAAGGGRRGLPGPFPRTRPPRRPFPGCGDGRGPLRGPSRARRVRVGPRAARTLRGACRRRAPGSAPPPRASGPGDGGAARGPAGRGVPRGDRESRPPRAVCGGQPCVSGFRPDAGRASDRSAALPGSDARCAAPAPGALLPLCTARVRKSPRGPRGPPARGRTAGKCSVGAFVSPFVPGDFSELERDAAGRAQDRGTAGSSASGSRPRPRRRRAPKGTCPPARAARPRAVSLQRLLRGIPGEIHACCAGCSPPGRCVTRVLRDSVLACSPGP